MALWALLWKTEQLSGVTGCSIDIIFFCSLMVVVESSTVCFESGNSSTLMFWDIYKLFSYVFVQSLSCVWIPVTPLTAACQASLSFTVSGVCSSSCPLSQWFYPSFSSSATSFSFCLQSLQAAGSFPMSWLFELGGQSIRASTLAPVLPVSIQGWFPLGLAGYLRLRCLSASLIPRLVKNLPAMQEILVQFLAQEDFLEKG